MRIRILNACWKGWLFLLGNLRQKIEDEFPELTHGLIKMLWPNYLRPVPAMTLIEYTPDMDKSSVLGVNPP
ncbi:type VI secretion system baseplate subunit TssF [Escherichia coli]